MRRSLITCTELFTKINSGDKKIKLFDATYPNRIGVQLFKRQKIGGAEFLFLESFSDKTSKYTLTFPSSHLFSHLEKKLKVAKEDEIIFYDMQGSFHSPRAFFLFKAFNYKNIYLLDGGLPKWRSLNLPYEEVNSVGEDPTSDFKSLSDDEEDPTVTKEILSGFEEIKSHNNRKNFIVDTRNSKAFQSKSIPGSANIQFFEFFNEDLTFKSKEDLLELFKSRNVNPYEPGITTSCGFGLSSSIAYFALSEILGNNSAKMYDGSMEEYVDKLNTHHNNL